MPSKLPGTSATPAQVMERASELLAESIRLKSMVDSASRRLSPGVCVVVLDSLDFALEKIRTTGRMIDEATR